MTDYYSWMTGWCKCAHDQEQPQSWIPAILGGWLSCARCGYLITKDDEEEALRILQENRSRGVISRS